MADPQVTQTERLIVAAKERILSVMEQSGVRMNYTTWNLLSREIKLTLQAMVMELALQEHTRREHDTQHT